jgi:hypothetical protein
MAALIKHFDGYGFGEGGGHGILAYADSLLAEAKRLEVEGPRQATPQEQEEIRRRFVDAVTEWAKRAKRD